MVKPKKYRRIYWQAEGYDYMSDEECVALTEKLRRRELSGTELYKAIHVLGEEGWVEGKDVIASYLTDEEPDIRRIAINVLVLHLGLKDYYPVARDFLSNDPEEEVQMWGAFSIGTLFKGTGNKEAINFLLPFFLDEKRDYIFRDAIYYSILLILGIPVLKTPKFKNPDDLNRKVDWDFIEKLKSGEHPKKGYGYYLGDDYKIKFRKIKE